MAREKEKRRSMRERVGERARENKFSGGADYLKLPDDITQIKITKGSKALDILPFEIQQDEEVIDVPGKKELELKAGDLWFHRSLLVHRNIGSEERKYICPRTAKKPCPICEERARLMKSSNADEDYIKTLKPQHVDLFNVIDVDAKKPEVQVMAIPYANFRKFLEQEIREHRHGDKYQGFADLEGGYTLEIRFSEETFGGNPFIKATRIDFQEREDYKEKILEKTVDLDSIFTILPYDKLSALFYETGGEEEDDRGGRRSRSKEEEEDRPKRGRRDKEEEEEDRPRRGSRHGEEDEDRPKRGKRDEEEEPPSRSRRGKRDEPEEPEEDKPKRSRRGKEEEEEEEKPKRPRRTKDAEEEEDKPKRGGKAKEKEEEPEEGECPNDGEFGKDCDELPECVKCKVWEECKDESDRLSKKRKK